MKLNSTEIERERLTLRGFAFLFVVPALCQAKDMERGNPDN